MSKLLQWVVRKLSPRAYADLLAIARYTAEHQSHKLRAEYERKLTTLVRTQQPDSVWLARFALLDADYRALEKDLGNALVKVAEARVLIHEAYGRTDPFVYARWVDRADRFLQ